jgi:hypothetical protein
MTLLALTVASNGFAAASKTKTVLIDSTNAPKAMIVVYPAKGSMKPITGNKMSIELERDANIFGKNIKYIKDIEIASPEFDKLQKVSDMKGQIDYINKMLEAGANTINIGVGAGVGGKGGSLQIGVKTEANPAASGSSSWNDFMKSQGMESKPVSPIYGTQK